MSHLTISSAGLLDDSRVDGGLLASGLWRGRRRGLAG